MENFAEHFQEYLIIGLLLALFFKESLTEFVNAKLGIEGKEEKVPEWGATLTHYANHETTDRLVRLIDLNERAHEQLRNIDSTLNEFKEYGIKIRKQ